MDCLWGFRQNGGREDHHFPPHPTIFSRAGETQPEESVASAGAQESEGKAETSQQHVAHPDHSCDDPDYSLDDPDHSCDDPDHIYSAR